MVDGVVTAPQDPVVRGQPVVVELVAQVADALPVPPPDRGELRRAERLGHQHVVIDRHDVGPQPAHQRGERVGAERDLLGPQHAVAGPHGHAVRVAGQAGGRRALGDADADPLAGGGQPPGEPGRLDHRGRHPCPSCPPGRWGSSPRPASRRRRGRRRRRLPRPRGARRPGNPRWLPSMEPVRSKSQSMPYRPSAASIASRFSAPRRCSVANSAGNRSRPLAAPWVRLASQNPPLRPLAAQPTRLPSITSTDRPGLASLASRAAHSPVNPPPITARSQARSPRSGSRAAGASGWSSQNGFGLGRRDQPAELSLARRPPG